MNTDTLIRLLPDFRPGDDPCQVELDPTRPWPGSWVRHLAEGGLKAAGVLVPLIERRHGITVLMTRRAQDLPHHPGQVSFPGGRMEDNDRDIVATALRETQEEIGVNPARVTVAGVLDRLPTITGYAVTPIVGLLQPRERLTLDPGEVESAFEVPLDYLLDARNVIRTERLIEGVEVPLLESFYGGERIWGATAAMLKNLKEYLLQNN